METTSFENAVLTCMAGSPPAMTKSSKSITSDQCLRVSEADPLPLLSVTLWLLP